MRLFLVIFAVEALTASWIEIQSICILQESYMSKPSRLRGLKYPGWRRCSPRLKGRSPCGFVD